MARHKQLPRQPPEGLREREYAEASEHLPDIAVGRCRHGLLALVTRQMGARLQTLQSVVQRMTMRIECVDDPCITTCSPGL